VLLVVVHPAIEYRPAPAATGYGLPVFNVKAPVPMRKTETLSERLSATHEMELAGCPAAKGLPLWLMVTTTCAIDVAACAIDAEIAINTAEAKKRAIEQVGHRIVILSHFLSWQMGAVEHTLPGSGV
jgi:hypothetical protein